LHANTFSGLLGKTPSGDWPDLQVKGGTRFSDWKMVTLAS